MRRHFFIIGGQRCATTLLWQALDAHPDIEMAQPLRPEPKYFLSDAPRSREDYARRFFSADTPLRGEKSTSYSDRDEALTRICDFFPQARFVMLLRDPVERAISNIRFSRDNGFETAPVEEALLRELDGEVPPAGQARETSVPPQAYLTRSFYTNRLDRISAIIPPDRLGVFQTEKLVRDSDVLARILRFVGAAPLSGSAETPRHRVNAATGDEKDAVQALSPTVLARLRAHFAPMRPALAARYGVDMSLWDTTFPEGRHD